MNDEIERLLTEAGKSWRRHRPDPAAPTAALFADSRPSRGRARLVALAAAAAVVVIAGGVIGLKGWWDGSAPPATVPDSVVVHDGDTVSGTGKVVIAPDGAARFCPTFSLSLTGKTDCSDGVPVTNVASARLDNVSRDNGTTTGYAWLEGTWRDRTITVTRQEGFQSHPDPALPISPPTPCGPPAGGWTSGLDLGQRTALINYVEAHPDDYSGVWDTLPVSADPNDPDSQDRNMDIHATVVGVVGDIDAARDKLAAVYTGNLCVISAPHSRAELLKAQEVFDTRTPYGLETDDLDIDPWKSDPNRVYVSLTVIVLDGPMRDLINQAGGPELVSVRPWLRKSPEISVRRSSSRPTG
jgi:hypothetical protein